MKRLRFFILIVLSAASLAGCAYKPWMAEADRFYIAEVEVSRRPDSGGTVNLAENVRVKTLREASRYPAEGRPKILKVELKRIHFKNPAMSYALSDKNQLKGRITLIDAETGISHGNLKISVADKWLLQGITGMIQAGLDNPIDAEQRLAAKFSKKILERLYGTEVATKMAGRKPTLSPEPFYTASYTRLKRRRVCRILRNQRRKDPSEAGGDLYQEVPGDCKASVVAKSPDTSVVGENRMVLPANDMLPGSGGTWHAGSYPRTREAP